ncbi:MAG: tetratricopeptide repeat protein [Prevotella sp.]|nr:tetratricopeptide repeat protein [Prevotella sp.]
MDLEHLIQHPEQMDKETLYDLRSLLALYPYFQTARVLMLQNLYLLHDSSFDEELRRAAVYITDRKVIFNLVEAAHYKLRVGQQTTQKDDDNKDGSRTVTLIDQFLDSLPAENSEKPKGRRKPTPADAAVDYVAYLLESEEQQTADESPQMKGQDLIDNFINKDGGKFELKDTPEIQPQLTESEKEDGNDSVSQGEEGYFTETLARIYIKQGRYSKALEIIKQLNLNYPKKNAYFADQIRFLEKLILNNKYK